MKKGAGYSVEKGKFSVIPTTEGRRDLARSFDEFRICG